MFVRKTSGPECLPGSRCGELPLADVEPVRALNWQGDEQLRVVRVGASRGVGEAQTRCHAGPVRR